MKQIIYNTQTKALSRIYENGYNVPIPEHEKAFIYVLEVIEPSQPVYNTANQRLSGKWVIDTDASQYKKVWTVTDKTAYELACEAWGQMDYAWKIIAPISLLDPINPENDLFHKFYNYLMAQGLPSENIGANKVIWCNEIQPQHVNYIQSLADKGVVIEQRP